MTISSKFENPKYASTKSHKQTWRSCARPALSFDKISCASAYKLVSLLKIWWYGLDPRQIGCHMVIHDYAATDGFWILYTIVGVGLPLYGYYLYSTKVRPFLQAKMRRH